MKIMDFVAVEKKVSHSNGWEVLYFVSLCKNPFLIKYNEFFDMINHLKYSQLSVDLIYLNQLNLHRRIHEVKINIS